MKLFYLMYAGIMVGVAVVMLMTTTGCDDRREGTRFERGRHDRTVVIEREREPRRTVVIERERSPRRVEVEREHHRR